jgi:hypothetical protein
MSARFDKRQFLSWHSKGCVLVACLIAHLCNYERYACLPWMASRVHIMKLGLMLVLCTLVVASSSEVERPNLWQPSLRYSCLHWVQQALAANTSTQQHESDSCLATHGSMYLDSWRAATLDLCLNDSAPAISPSPSSAICYTQPAAALTACVGRNIRIHTSDLIKQHETPSDDKAAEVVDRDDILSSSGSSLLACSPPEHDEGLPTLPVTVFHKERVAYDASAPAEACSGVDPDKVVMHPVLFVTRVDNTNAYHHTEVLVTAFAALASINVSARAAAAGFQVRHVPPWIMCCLGASDPVTTTIEPETPATPGRTSPAASGGLHADACQPRLQGTSHTSEHQQASLPC